MHDDGKIDEDEFFDFQESNRQGNLHVELHEQQGNIGDINTLIWMRCKRMSESHICPNLRQARSVKIGSLSCLLDR